MKRYVNYGRKVSWIVKIVKCFGYGNYGRKVSWMKRENTEENMKR